MENDRPDAYNAHAARLAWERTITFLHEQLDAQMSPCVEDRSHLTGFLAWRFA